MYDSNCAERWEHGQHPYKTMEDYVATNEKWLVNKYSKK